MPDVALAKFGAVAHMNPPGDFEGPALASAASVTLSHPVHKITGTTAITTLIPPHSGFIGRVTLLATGAWTFGTGGNIAGTMTAAAGKAYFPYFDGTSWYPDA